MPSTVPSPNSYSLRICSNSSTFAFLSIPRLLLLQQDASGLRGGPFYSIEMGGFRVSKSWAAVILSAAVIGKSSGERGLDHVRHDHHRVPLRPGHDCSVQLAAA